MKQRELELEDFYEQLTRIREQCQNHDVNIVMGEMNAKVGNGRHEDIVGQYGLGEKNTRGQKLIDWCTQHQQVITNTWFRHYGIQDDYGHAEAQATGTEIKLTI